MIHSFSKMCELAFFSTATKAGNSRIFLELLVVLRTETELENVKKKNMNSSKYF